MDERTRAILYSTADGKLPEDVEDVSEAAEYNEEDIPFQRFSRIKSLIDYSLESETIFLSLEAAIILTAWGDEDGLAFIKRFIALKVDNFENMSPHRIYGYDTTLESILNALSFYNARNLDRGKEEKAQSVVPIANNIIENSGGKAFDISCIYGLIKRVGYKEFKNSLEVYLKDVIQKNKTDYTKYRDANIADLLDFIGEIQ